MLTCINGHFVAIEVKADNGEPSKLQLLNVKKIREAGGIAIILYPSQWDIFTEFINDLLENNVNPYCINQYKFDRR